MSRIQEGEQHLIEAAKCLKTGLLKWKPDYDIAGTEYEKAGRLEQLFANFNLNFNLFNLNFNSNFS